MEKIINNIINNVLGTAANNIKVYRHPESHSHRADLNTEVIGKITLPENDTFFRTTIDMGRVIGKDHLIETHTGDQIVYLQRGNRPGLSRMVLNRVPDNTQFVTAIFCVCREEPGTPDELVGKWILVTLFEGKPGEREPFDRAFASADKDPETAKALAKAWAFWATHALVPTDEELAQIKNGEAEKLTLTEISWTETNEFANPDKANNGGGYSQPEIHVSFSDGVRGVVYDASCGDFGTRISACFQIGSDAWVANWGTMEDHYESEIPEKLFKEHIQLIEERYGYRIPTKEQCAQWGEEEAEWEDSDWE